MSSNPACYVADNYFIGQAIGYLPCTAPNGAVVGCCAAGDYCLQDGICYKGSVARNGTGYYTGGCTDIKFVDDACPKVCLSEWSPDITYDNSDNQWLCCSNHGSLDCLNPSTITIDAPGPADLATLSHLTQSVSKFSYSSVTFYSTLPQTTTTSTKRSSATVTNTASKTAASIGAASASTSASATARPSSSGLSGGAIAGIVIGVVAAIALIAGVAAWFFIRRRRRSTGPSHAETVDEKRANPIIYEPVAAEPSELPAAPGDERRSELWTDGVNHQRNKSQELNSAQSPRELVGDIPTEEPVKK